MKLSASELVFAERNESNFWKQLSTPLIFDSERGAKRSEQANIKWLINRLFSWRNIVQESPREHRTYRHATQITVPYSWLSLYFTTQTFERAFTKPGNFLKRPQNPIKQRRALQKVSSSIRLRGFTAVR